MLIQNLISVFSSALQVIDFGSSCYEHQRVYTYIQSRFYRAPEVILGARYGMPIDMWSLGCILAELLTGYPLLPGEDEGDQLSCIIELLGMPPQKLLDQSKRAKNFISSKGKYLQSSEAAQLFFQDLLQQAVLSTSSRDAQFTNTNSQKEKEIF